MLLANLYPYADRGTMPTKKTETDDEYIPFDTFDPEDSRPDDCECWDQEDLSCFPCYMAGFETPNPDAPYWTGRDPGDE